MDEIDRRPPAISKCLAAWRRLKPNTASVSEWKAEFQDPVMEQLLAGRWPNQPASARHPAEVQQLFAATPADASPIRSGALPRTRPPASHHRSPEGGCPGNFLDSIRTAFRPAPQHDLPHPHSKTPAASTKAVATRTSTAGNSPRI